MDPFCGQVSPKIDKVSEELTLRYPHEEPGVGRVLPDILALPQSIWAHLQGYLAHEKLPRPRTLQ